MGEQPIVSASVPQRLKNQIEEYADRKGLSRSEAINRLIEQGLEMSQSEVTVIYGDQEIVTDGGQLAQRFSAEMSSLQEQAEEIEKRVEKEAEKRQNREVASKRLTAILAVAVVWLGTVTVFSLPSLGVIFSGAGIIALLLYQLYHYQNSLPFNKI